MVMKLQIGNRRLRGKCSCVNSYFIKVYRLILLQLANLDVSRKEAYRSELAHNITTII